MDPLLLPPWLSPPPVPPIRRGTHDPFPPSGDDALVGTGLGAARMLGLLRLDAVDVSAVGFACWLAVRPAEEAAHLRRPEVLAPLLRTLPRALRLVLLRDLGAATASGAAGARAEHLAAQHPTDPA